MIWPKRLYVLDASRGLAALAVVVYHWKHFSATIPLPATNYLKILYIHGQEGVNYFFILSGFIFFWIYKDRITSRSISLKRFALYRFARLYPLHLLTLVFVAVCQLVYMTATDHYFIYGFNDVYHFLLNLVLINQWGFQSGGSFNGPVWSVSVEELMYLIFFALCLMRIGKATFCIGASVVMFLVGKSLYFEHEVFNGLSMFFLGGFVYHMTRYVSAKGNVVLTSLVQFIALASWIYVIAHYYYTPIAEPIRSLGPIGTDFMEFFPGYILFSFTICSLALFEINGVLSAKRLAWLGDLSYSMYMIHFPLQMVCVIAVFYRAIEPTFFTRPISLVLFMAILIGLSKFLHTNFEAPLRKLIRGGR